MAIFPRIQSPCPYKSNLAAMMDGDVCRMCKREVFDLNAMSDDERVAFISGCETEVCVSYKIPMGPVMAAALATAALAPSLAAAQVAPAVPVVDCEELVIMVGGITDPSKAQFVKAETAEDMAIPELPVVYEAENAAETVKVAARPASSQAAS